MTRHHVLMLVFWPLAFMLCAWFWAVLITGCAKTHAGSGYHAEAIGGPAGLTCVVVLDDQGSAHGGGCTH